MTLREFAAMGGFKIERCDPSWGGPIAYRDGPNTTICGFKSEAKALEHWLASQFSKEMIAALKALTSPHAKKKGKANG